MSFNNLVVFPAHVHQWEGAMTSLRMKMPDQRQVRAGKNSARMIHLVSLRSCDCAFMIRKYEAGGCDRCERFYSQAKFKRYKEPKEEEHKANFSRIQGSRHVYDR